MGSHAFRFGASTPVKSTGFKNWTSTAWRREPRQQNRRHQHRPRRKRLSHAARNVFLACVIAVAFSENDDPEECEAPRVVKFNFKHPISHPPACTPRNAHQLGDGIRNNEATGVFFDSLDSDGDGAIEPEEVAMFLQHEIGGKQFDTQIEVDEEVGTIMESLDRNQNNGLEMSDMLDYWMKLESLLTAEEVSEWIVYSVQLPISVGKIFLENGITGYDFLEIVDNGGGALRNELGITKTSFQNKIVRQMQSRMLGIGSSPGTPTKFNYRLESCKAIVLKWDRSTARVFPVHSYRIQRRAINLFGSVSLNDITLTNSNHFDSHTTPNSGWKTVYVGGEIEFVDSGLGTGHNYMYRIQAWNSAGRSDWETIDLTRDLKKQRCSTKPSQPDVVHMRDMPHIEVGSQWELISTTKNVLGGIATLVQFIHQSVRFFLAFFALLAGMMRFRRATATSSASAHTTLPFPWIWNTINHACMKVNGQELIPRTMLGDRDAIMRQEQLHDERIAASGLRGYDRVRQKAQSEEAENRNADLNHMNKRITFKSTRSHSAGDLTLSKRSFAPPKEVVIPCDDDQVCTPVKFSWMRKHAASFGNNSGSSAASSVAASRNMSGSDIRSLGGQRILSGQSHHNRCSECQKKFKIGKRYKHHCSRCMATFCHKHGHTTHSNLTSCRVPGDCLCNSCLGLLRLREHSTISNHSE